MATHMISNTVTTSVREPKRKKNKKKLQAAAQATSANWKSEAQQNAYSSKLLTALRQLRLDSAPRRSRAVREAADRALAVAAKAKTRWSRAILTNRLKLKFAKSKRQRVPSPGSSRAKKPRVSILRLKGKNLPAVQRKARVLGRLVPGCKKEALPVVLEEATDYIKALEMQVRAMSTLAELLSGPSVGSTSSPELVSRADHSH